MADLVNPFHLPGMIIRGLWLGITDTWTAIAELATMIRIMRTTS